MSACYSMCGVNTRFWGRALWKGLHSITFGYPNNPTDEDAKHYKIFFETLAWTLPCSLCRESYSNFIKGNGHENTWLANNIFETRMSLVKWLFDVHNKVNEKLGFPMHLSFDKFVYEYKKKQTECSSDAPIIPFSTYFLLEKYIKERNIPCFWNKKGGNIKESDYIRIISSRKSPIWTERNKLCKRILNMINTGSIDQMEKTGNFAGMPSRYELLLISMFCTSLEESKMDTLCEKIVT